MIQPDDVAPVETWRRFARGFCIALAIWIAGLAGGLRISYFSQSDSQIQHAVDAGSLQAMTAKGESWVNLDAADIFVNNMRVVLTALCGALTGSLTTVVVLFANGFHSGVMWSALTSADITSTQVLGVTIGHGIPELAGLFAASAAGLCGFRLLGQLLRSRSLEAFRQPIPLFVAAAILATLLTAVAAAIEADTLTQMAQQNSR